MDAAPDVISVWARLDWISERGEVKSTLQCYDANYRKFAVSVVHVPLSL